MQGLIFRLITIHTYRYHTLLLPDIKTVHSECYTYNRTY